MTLAGLSTSLNTKPVAQTQGGEATVVSLAQLLGGAASTDVASFDEELLAIAATLGQQTISPTLPVLPSEGELLVEPLEQDLVNDSQGKTPLLAEIELAASQGRPVIVQTTTAESENVASPIPELSQIVSAVPKPSEWGLESAVDSSTEVQKEAAALLADVPISEDASTLVAEVVPPETATPLSSEAVSAVESTVSEDNSGVDIVEMPSVEYETVPDGANDSAGDAADDTAGQSEAQVAVKTTDMPVNLAAIPFSIGANAAVDQASDTAIVDPPNLAEQIANEAVKHAEVVKHQGQQRFTMRLDPPELGKLVVEMERTERGIALRVNAVDPATLGLIQSSVDELNSNLTNQQDSIFQEVNIDVTTGEDSHRSFDDRDPKRTIRHTDELLKSDDPQTSRTANQQNVDFVA